LQLIESPPQSIAPHRFEVFEYQEVLDTPLDTAWEAWVPEEVGKSSDPVPEEPVKKVVNEVNEAALRTEFETKLAEETRKAFEAGRERGQLEGRQAEREAMSAAQSSAEEQRAQQIAVVIENFVQERDRYMQMVEHEVVHLSLAVAARIMRREAQMDPLLLTGAVRVALGQLAGSTQVRLRVPPAELDLWIESMALLPNLSVKPTVVPGDGMLLGDCVIETELGSVDLGIRSQLGEIERGFFDRSGVRKVETDDSAPAPGDRRKRQPEVQQ
jgi:flagellar assembly protein FliH